ncbi:hypothetical protein M432DRAFT_642900 [Thermoascus aurantiacus ATCC 26904]
MPSSNKSNSTSVGGLFGTVMAIMLSPSTYWADVSQLARATGRELDEQNRHLERIMAKSDYVDDQI